MFALVAHAIDLKTVISHTARSTAESWARLSVSGTSQARPGYEVPLTEWSIRTRLTWHRLKSTFSTDLPSRRADEYCQRQPHALGIGLINSSGFLWPMKSKNMPGLCFMGARGIRGSHPHHTLLRNRVFVVQASDLVAYYIMSAGSIRAIGSRGSSEIFPS